MFIIAAEVLARSLKNLFEDPLFMRYEMPKWSRKINHLSYANEIILFCPGHLGSMKKMIRILREYEYMSGHMVNLDKSLFYLHERTPIRTCNIIRRIIGISQGTFSFTYLRCPVFYGREKKACYKELLKKVMKRLNLWQYKLLAFGGRYVFISHVLQSMLHIIYQL